MPIKPSEKHFIRGMPADLKAAVEADVDALAAAYAKQKKKGGRVNVPPVTGGSLARVTASQIMHERRKDETNRREKSSAKAVKTRKKNEVEKPLLGPRGDCPAGTSKKEVSARYLLGKSVKRDGSLSGAIEWPLRSPHPVDGVKLKGVFTMPQLQALIWWVSEGNGAHDFI